MAKSNSKLKAVSEPTQTDREAAMLALAGEDISQIADHLQDLSDLLYENQDKYDSLVVGVQCLLDGFATRLDKIAGYFREPQSTK